MIKILSLYIQLYFCKKAKLKIKVKFLYWKFGAIKIQNVLPGRGITENFKPWTENINQDSKTTNKP